MVLLKRKQVKKIEKKTRRKKIGIVVGVGEMVVVKTAKESQKKRQRRGQRSFLSFLKFTLVVCQPGGGLI